MIRRSDRTKIPVKEVIERYLMGESENVVAKAYGVSRNVIRRHLEVACVHIRSSSEAESLKWSRMTNEQRQRQVAKAHEAVRGTTKTHEEKVNRAQGVQRACRLSPYEKLFYEAFKQADVKVIPQYAFDVFNIDFAIPNLKLAIEIDGGNWHDSPRKRLFDERKNAVLEDAGWSIVRFETHQRKIQDLVVDAVKSVSRLIAERR